MTSKVERINKMLEDAKAEEGRLVGFKSFARAQMEDNKWVSDDLAPFGLIVGDSVCMVSDGGTTLTGTVEYTGLNDDDEYYVAMVKYVNEEGDEEVLALGEPPRTHFITILA